MIILVCGATGSVGQQTIKVIKHLKHKIVGITFNKNLKKAKSIIKSNNIKYCYSPIYKQESNVKGYDELIKKTKPDLVVNAVVGFAGLEVTMAAIKNKVDIALANKESLVVAGKYVMRLAKNNHVNIYPVDSEHAAITQAIGNKQKELKTIYITASGGPFYNKNNLNNITYKQAINHPNWKMGPKISIDSATLVNKCFEIIEAYWLFNTKNIVPIYHPQSIVHSMVEFKDNSIAAIISKPNMELPIQLALSKFKSDKSSLISPLNFKNLNLNFDLIDENKYLPIKWAKEVLENPDSSLPIVINAANEELIKLFANNKIKFKEITYFINLIINKIKIIKITSFKQIFIVDQLTRKFVQNLVK